MGFVQAFVSVTIKGDLYSEISVNGSSVNMKDGLVTINEGITVKVDKELTPKRSFGTWVSSFLFIGGGTAIAGYGVIKSKTEAQVADEYFSKYKNAKTAEDAKTNKAATKKHDQSSTNYQLGASIGLIAIAYGVHYFVTNKEFDTNYHYNISFSTEGNNNSIATNLGWRINL